MGVFVLEEPEFPVGGEEGDGAVTGIAGPGGGTPDKPVGTVWFAVSGPDGDVAEVATIAGMRDMVRERAAWRLLGLGWRHVR